jgi:hypothetical protein
VEGKVFFLPRPSQCELKVTTKGELASLGREYTQGLQHGSVLNTLGSVNAQDIDCRSTHGRRSNKTRPTPSEVRRPLVIPGVKKRNQLPCIRIIASNIRSLESVARRARQTEIKKGGSAMMLPSADVIDFVRKRRKCLG